MDMKSVTVGMWIT